MSENQKMPETPARGRSRRRVRQFPWKTAGAVFLAAAAVLAACYIGAAQRYRRAYLPHTTVNGMDVSGKTAEEVKEVIAQGVERYVLTLSLRGGERQELAGSQMGLTAGFDGSLEEIIRQQNPYAWFRYLLKGPDYDITAMITYDETMLEDSLSALPCFDAEQTQPPEDARLSDYEPGTGYTILPETEGNQLDWEKAKEAVEQAATHLTESVDLDVLGCYREPALRSDAPALEALRDEYNRYVGMTVTYRFGSSREILDGSEIHTWLKEENGQVTLDPEKVTEYVKTLGKKYNTAYTTRTFHTSYGQEVQVQGFYGWRISQSAEVKELTAVLEAGQSVEREPVYLQEGASHDGNDYGSTYAEVNLTAQHMFFYKDGKRVLETDFVSGNLAKGYTTPPGIFGITYKQRDAVLKGQGYASPVNFWMPFNGGIGFHDAGWRSSFGGTIYKKNGSHGCINMPYEAAKTLYANVYAGMPVICYNLAGTEQTSQTKISGTSAPPETLPEQTQPAQTQPAQTQPAQTQPAQTQPAETQPAQTQPAETQPAQTQPTETQPAQIQPADPGASSGGPGTTQPADSGTEGGPGTAAPETQPVETQPAQTAAGVIIQPVEN